MTEKLDLDALARLLAAATPVKWMFEPGDDSPNGDVYHENPNGYEVALCVDAQDGPLIVALRNSAPQMIAEIRALRAVAAAARDYRVFQRADPQTEFERVSRDVGANEARIAIDAALKEAGL